jgi:hypothetical protein
MKVIIDTNVLIAANGRDCPQVTVTCRLHTGKYLITIQQKGTIAIDDQWLILKEYKNKVNPSGQPGIGDAFLKWILTNQANPERCDRVKIHLAEGIEEFPDDSRLEKFDRSDRKFVAVARAAPDKPPIINAVDSDWMEFYKPLAECGVQIEFLCPDIVAPPLRQKR